MKTFLAGWLVALAAVGNAVAAEFAPLPNPDFTRGDEAPNGWTLSGGQGRWVDKNILEVAGTGKDSNFWRCDYRFTPGGLYHFQMRTRRLGGSGCVVAGPAFANRDRKITGDWKYYDHVFRVPDDVTDSYIRLGQWQSTGKVQFDSARLVPALPVYKEIGEAVLGNGESIRDGRYTFSATFDQKGSNHHRPLIRATAEFNSNRWVFHDGDEVVYRFELPGLTMRTPRTKEGAPAPGLSRGSYGRVSFNVSYHVRGECIAEVSPDGKSWRKIAMQNKVGTAEAALPPDAASRNVVYLRLKTSGKAYFQVDRIEFSAPLDGAPPDAVGETLYADMVGFLDRLAFGHATLRKESPSEIELDVPVRYDGKPLPDDAARRLRAMEMAESLRYDGVDGTCAAELVADSDRPDSERVNVSMERSGDLKVTIHVRTKRGKPLAWLTIPVSVPEYYRADYGKRIAGVKGPVGVWWCRAAWKVPRQRALPSAEQATAAAEMSAARDDREAVQIIVRADDKPLKRLTARASDLRADGGATIPAKNIKVLRVAYHHVHHPTDRTGIRDFWPDALPPLRGPIDVPAGENQPIWVLVHVPENAKAGDYTGELSLAADGFSAKVPIRLHVWNFALPKRNHIETAFGLSAGNVWRYHQLKTEEDKRRVFDMYLKCFAEHRISPYDPAPLDPIRVKFQPEAKPPRAEVDFSAFDPVFRRAVEEYHFTNFRLPIQGMGGGSFHKRYPPKIGNFTEETPEYHAMFASYVKQLESHFREKGWLKIPYIYWFDEPAPKDYAFVRGGFERLKKYAPGLTTMLTEQPEEALAGPVDIWCPVSPNYNHAAAEKRRKHGERFWWYVCCGPKAPYCTLFIDHPATELRVWLWQTWQRDISGILVWRANYWTSSAAYPDSPQNPYEDPMGYVSGYSTPKGTKRYWGNGDGRFIYPPEAAAAPGISGPKPVIESPVSSIRWEMLREGIEDWEYLYLLRELLEKHRKNLSPEQMKRCESLLKVPESITKSMTDFTTDPAPIYERRKAIAEAIEQLSK